MASIKTLKGLVALVTGGASGLGRATAERLLQQGARVVICDLKTSKGQDVANDLGGDCTFVPTNVTSEGDVQNALNITKSKYQKLNIAVNCAGISVAFKVYNFLKNRTHKLEDAEDVIKTNTIGSFNVMRLACRLMSENEPDENGLRGVIVNTSGSSAFDGIVGQSVYAASCHSIVSMTHSVARDLDCQGIRCCAIAPGFINTELLAPLPEEVVNFIANTTPSPKRFGKPEEFAHLVQNIIENPALNGTVIRLDGGCRMQL